MSSMFVTEHQAGERIDKFLATKYTKFSRSAIEKLIKDSSITVNGKPVRSKYVLKVGDEVQANFTQLTKQPETIKLPILYEDENVVVLNKPVEILTHSKGMFNKEGTVATWLRTHISRHSQLDLSVLADKQVGWKSNSNDIAKSDTNSDWGLNQVQNSKRQAFWESNRAGIVHRLDRATSGVIICAKNESTQKQLQKQFSQRKVKKTYYAVVSGEMPKAEGEIDIPIERNPKKPATFRASVNGKTAHTAFKVVASNGKYSLLELKPTTGRTHQLRVHLSYLKHPIVGDDFYTGESATRLLLHASELEVTLPGGKRAIFKADLPAEFMDYIK